MRGNEKAAEFCQNALNDVCFGRPDDTEVTIRRYFTKNYLQTTDGETSDLRQFVEHISKLRSVIREGRIEVIDAIQEGARIAERHIVGAMKTDGKEVQFRSVIPRPLRKPTARPRRFQIVPPSR